MNSGEPSKLSKREKCLRSRSDCDLTDFKCLRCKTDFSSIKTLYFHMFSVHAEKRLYYKCPVCDYTFVQTWGVCRHLIAVHKKTKEEADLLKLNIETTTFPNSGNMKSNIHQLPTFDWKDADFESLKCLSCSRSFSTPANLRKHVARHLGLDF
ncbi:Zinc finger and BTB domain-containing protein like [Argiope bruennichi]|uniref:Zinc finger and BTB domain-containing protein like n=1 Tax=Argiope bruennichi TaxID=94029 RepID=A0A8T0FG81_ARGBR|nr:Zinc finger and BTB domain-containing protein like [Argiope bruennichi]